MGSDDIRPELSQVRSRFAELARERRRLEEAALSLGPMLEGSFAKRYVRCKKPGCKCERGERHGPYFSISRKDASGKTRLQYVRPGEVVVIHEMVKAHLELRKSMARLRRLNESILELIGNYGELRLKEGQDKRARLRDSKSSD